MAWLLASAVLASAAARTNALIIELEGQVTVSRAGTDAWNPARTNQLLLPRDRVRTLERSRATVRLSNLSTWRVAPNSLFQVPDDEQGGLHLLRGLLYYFHRDKPGTLPVRTPSAYAVILGTEFTVAVDPNGSTRIDLIDGQIDLTNEFGSLHLGSGEAAVAEPGRAPVRTPAIHAVNVVQWVLHYPAVLDAAELQLTPGEERRLARSLAAYRTGDLHQALADYPTDQTPTSADETLYRATLLLSVGEVKEAEILLQSLLPSPGAEARTQRLARSLETLIAAVKFRPDTIDSEGRAPIEPSPLSLMAGEAFATPSGTALLAESYYQQSRRDLEAARRLAQAATQASPSFGFAWARLAELEFSFGERTASAKALDQAERLTPHHAQARALRGFVMAAENRIAAALQSFDQAISLDGALGNAWLGRGLCRIRQGDVAAGREDLQVAATLEPQRALLRSYLGKAFGNEGDVTRARHELDLARTIDPQDPTGWLYSALLNQELNRINQSVRELEQARELNDGRQIYRSRLLLDQDAAVQGANLAGIHADAGMTDWSAREAGKAVQMDPANYAAHLFLGESYQRQRDPGRISQRFETPAVTEYLLANLLSPVGAGTLAQSVTHNEYSKLFESDGVGLSSSTEYLSRGAWEQSAVHHGTLRNSSFALSGFYRSDNGQRANQDSEQSEISLQFKQQLTPADSVYLHATRGTFEGGDLSAQQAPSSVSRNLRVREDQEPLLLGGFHHEWSPGSHTLALIGWIDDEQQLVNDSQPTLLMNKFPGGTNVAYALPVSLEQQYRASVGLFTAELQQIWQKDRHTAIVGVRFQDGVFDIRNEAANAEVPAAPILNGFSTPPQRIESDLNRASGYGYFHFQATSSLLLVAGLSYDWLNYPVNFRHGPVTGGEEDVDQLSPKGGFIWTPTRRTTVRAGYSQSLGGAGFDQSFRLEPTQVAGFNQAFRSIIPESIAGASTAAGFETWGTAIEHRLGHGTYLALSGEWLRSDVDRAFGTYDFGLPTPAPPIVDSSTRERLKFEERTLLLTANQLLNDEWSLGLRYRLSHADLETHFPDIPEPVVPGTVAARTDSEAVLHQANFFAIYHHPSGFFGLAEALWNGQVDHGDAAMEDDEFWQFNVQAGWRGWRRRFEIRAGVLNLTDQDYRLNPINLSGELPRERTFMARCVFHF